MNKEIEQLIEYDKAYYNGEGSIITDKEYDELKSELQSKFPDDPYFLTIEPTNENNKFKHTFRLQSLNKIHNINDVNSWINKQDKSVKIFYMTPKYDGMSLALYYNNGNLDKIVTRGDGTVGQDVSFLLNYLEIDKTIDLKEGSYVFRAEAIISKNNWNNKIFKDDKNPRNTVSGLVNSEKNITDDKIKKMKFIDVVLFDCLNKDFEFLTKNKSLFNKNKIVEYTEIINEGDVVSKVKECYNKHTETRETFRCDLDGVVISTGYQDYSQHKPMHKLALKFPYQYVSTEIIDFNFDVGPSGRVTPIAILKPVDIMGSTIQRVSLHNMDHIKQKYGVIKIGDKVELTKRGDIIPQIERILESNNGQPIEMPTKVLDQDVFTKGIFHYIYPPIELIVEKFLLSYDISNLGAASLKKYLDEYNVLTLTDFVQLKLDDRLQEYAVYKLLKEALVTIRNPTMKQLLLSINIEGIGSRAVDKILENNGSGKTVEELIKNNPLTGVIGENYKNGLLKNKNFLNYWFTQITIKEEQYLKMQLVAITGTLSKSRAEFEKDLNKLGFKLSSTVKKDIECLICGEDPGEDKITKAKKYGLPIISEEEFITKYKE